MRTCQKKKKNLMSKMYFMGLSVNVIYFERVKYHILKYLSSQNSLPNRPDQYFICFLPGSFLLAYQISLFLF
jgi:hypothetical protein